MTDFLNQLLPPQHQIAELNFRNTEQLPDIPLECKAIFDIHCISTTGERFILETHFDKWIYFLKNLESFDHIPAILKEPVFEKAFHTAELANLNREQYAAYETNLLDYWTAKAVVVTAWEEGKQEGLAEGLEKGEKRKALETARKMREKGFSVEDVCELTGLRLEDVQELINHLKPT